MKKKHSSTFNLNEILFEKKSVWTLSVSQHFVLLSTTYSSLKTGKLEPICDVIYSRIRNEIYETNNIYKKAYKIHPIFPRICFYTTLPYSCIVRKNGTG